MRKLAQGMAALALPVVLAALGLASAQSADAQTVVGTVALYESGNISSNGLTGTCLVANGDSIYTQGGCTTDASQLNHAAQWIETYEGDSVQGYEYEFKNVHYGVCITVGSTGGAYGATCGTNHVQYWTIYWDGSSDGPNLPQASLVNIHTGYALCWKQGSSGTCQTTNVVPYTSNWDIETVS
jgi:hypothetical protein